MIKKIMKFDGDYRWLSNFYPVEIMYGKEIWPSAEALYQGLKTVDMKERELMRRMATPGMCKRYGKKLALRPDWEKIKLEVMKEVIRRKFLNPTLRAKLLATGDALLEEGNYWGDRFWGVCEGKGENWLGRILMEERKDKFGKAGAAAPAPSRKENIMNITVVNRHTFVKTKVTTYVGRPSVLGNPFIIGKDGNRAEVIEKYRQWLWKEYKKHGTVYQELKNILQQAQDRDIILSCSCAPLPCHADIIKSCLEWMNRK